MIALELETRDLIQVGVFTALYSVLFFATGCLGFFPIMFILMPAIVPIVTGIPFFLYLIKTDKFGMVTLLALLMGFLMFVTGHTWLPLVTAAICGVTADLIFRAGRYRSFRHAAVGYAVFSLWPIGAMLPLWVMRDSYLAHIRSGLGEDYVRSVQALTPDWVLFVMIGTAMLAGLAGAFLGRRVLAKHFRRSGFA